MLYRSMAGLAAALLLFGMVGTANADLIGDDVICSVSNLGGGVLTCNKNTETVSNSVEFQLLDSNDDVILTVNLFGGGVTIQARGNGMVADNTFLDLVDLEWRDQTVPPPGPIIPGTITGFSFTNGGGGGIIGLDENDVNTGPSSVAFDLSGITATFTAGQPRQQATIRFDVEHGADPIPEPATLLLFGSGLAGLGLWRWKNSKKS